MKCEAESSSPAPPNPKPVPGGPPLADEPLADPPLAEPPAGWGARRTVDWLWGTGPGPLAPLIEPNPCAEDRRPVDVTVFADTAVNDGPVKQVTSDDPST